MVDVLCLPERVKEEICGPKGVIFEHHVKYAYITVNLFPDVSYFIFFKDD